MGRRNILINFDNITFDLVFVDTFAEKPTFVKLPQELEVEENESVQFQCKANGDPTPTIVWKKEEGQIPQGRYDIFVNPTLSVDSCEAARAIGLSVRRTRVRGQILSYLRLVCSVRPAPVHSAVRMNTWL